MLRTQFIEAFKREVGGKPQVIMYKKWRVSVAQSLLLQNKPTSTRWRMKWGTTAILASLELFSMLRECRRAFVAKSKNVSWFAGQP